MSLPFPKPGPAAAGGERSTFDAEEIASIVAHKQEQIRETSRDLAHVGQVTAAEEAYMARLRATARVARSRVAGRFLDGAMHGVGLAIVGDALLQYVVKPALGMRSGPVQDKASAKPVKEPVGYLDEAQMKQIHEDAKKGPGDGAP